MRPPITSTTLQQNEGSRQQLQQQQQFQSKTSETTLQPHQQQLQQQQPQIARKIKLPQQQQHDIVVEKHLNLACTTQITHTQAVIKATHPKPISLARKASLATTQQSLSQPSSHSTYQASCKFDLKPNRNRLHNHNNGSNEETEEALDQLQQQLNDTHIDINDDDDDNDFRVQLVDLSTSPPSPLLLPLPAQHHSVEQLYISKPSAFEFPTKRSSIISDCQYSTQSSTTSSDDVSLSFNTNIAAFPTQRQQQQKLQQKHYHTSANSFDDEAENFIINFPGDSFLTQNQNDCIINLPLSETEPLLTNIESTVADKQRSICLNKNSASLIFTKKELPARTANINERRKFLTSTTTNNNHSSEQRQQQQQQQHNNKHSTNLNLNTRRCQSLRINYSTTSSDLPSLSSTANRRPTKHLPATYHQQQRRSLQLNYNNNLVTTSACSANNNNCDPTKATIKSTHSTNTALHHHLRSHPQSNVISSAAFSSTKGVNENRTTASTTRKQHAYSWYAPVYSALEEELEQDSRDSSPIHNNLANTKKHLTTTHYPHRSTQKHTTTSADNETVTLLETRNQINIQAQLHAQAQQSKSGNTGSGSGGGGGISISEGLPASQRKGNASAQALTLQFNSISGGSGSQATQNHETEGPHAGSLGLAGGPLPKRKRLENLEKFFKSLVGLRPSSNNGTGNTNPAATTNAGSRRSNSSIVETSPNPLPLPSSPEIRITRTPSDQNVEMSESERQLLRSTDKLAAQHGHYARGSTSSLHVVQQKLWNIMRRDASAASLYQDKSESLVQGSGMRKCETVLALSSRQGNPLHSPVHANCVTPGPHQRSVCSINHAPYMGSGIFNANGVEQIRPLNRLRNSILSINAANCSHCSSLLSLAASGSRYSLNASANGFVHSSASQQFLPSIPDSETVQNAAQPQHQQQPQRRYTSSGMVRRFSCGSRRSRSCSTSSRDENSLEPGVCTLNAVPPQRKISSCSCTSSSGISCSRKSSAGAHSTTTNSSSISPPSNQTTATLNSSLTPSSVSTALATTTSFSSTPTSPTITPTVNSCSTPIEVKHSLSPTAMAKASLATQVTSTSFEMHPNSINGHLTTETTMSRPFQMFTCKLCLIDVESVKEATTLNQCGCQFCTECMKAYVEFEISEGAYEISCPDAQCPAQGAMTLSEIANLTTTNLMKKHHRYRLNREIELDRTRTWCPRAGCETVCRVGGAPERHSDVAPSTSSAASNTPTSPLSVNGNEKNIGQLRCAVLCPSCNDEFCSACKKTWHPNMTCEENSRRLVADGQDDIGIPFDNDLIKCCPMCAVPIEKDEGCAQMMCKRCKHVFCWYCLASLDDDFLLRHYDKGPCKNKLGHSRASVVWHRAQVIGIFAGFGILLLVASPLLLLAAPCIICCKCRSCSSKIDEGDAELDEATQLQSF